jgi:(E)-4-hydroxy-3-methylbut-2-enyl-diphosphate synthase
VAEVPVARALVAPYNRLAQGSASAAVTTFARPEYQRRRSTEVTVGPRIVGGSRPVIVEVPLVTSPVERRGIRTELDGEAGVRVPEDTRAELVSVTLKAEQEIEDLERLRASMELVAPRVALSARWTSDPDALADEALGRLAAAVHRVHMTFRGPLDDPDRMALERAMAATREAGCALLIEASASGGNAGDAVDVALGAARLAAEAGAHHLMLALDPSAVPSLLGAVRRLAALLEQAALAPPLVLIDRPRERQADTLLGPSLALGGLLCEGIGDALLIETGSATESRKLVFGILQAARVRITRTEFISCPSCGRTLFDLEETTARIKSQTAHLKGVKIAVMGCIVNGPGEMADADFGYVGWGEDKIALFVGHEMVEKDIPTDRADQRLIELIKEHDRWVDPPVPATEQP